MEEQIPPSETVGALIRAAENGHLNVVRSLIERDWNDEDLDSDSDSDDWDGGYGYNGWGGRRERTRPTHITSVGGEACLAIHAAAINGHLEVAKYLHARVDSALTRDDEKDERQRLAKTVKSLARWLGESNNAAMVSGSTMVLAAKNGFLHVVQWLHDEFSVDTTMDLYEDYNIREEKVDTAMDMAASHGHLEVLQYLHEIGKSFRATPKRKRTSSIDSLYEFFSGPAKVLKTTPPKCTTAAMDGAAAHDRLDIVCWLHEHRGEGCSTAALDLAAKNGHLEIVQWIHVHRKECGSVTAMDQAASNGHLPIVKLLHENRNEGCTSKALNGASSGGHLKLVKWLHENRTEGCTTAAMSEAAAHGALDVVKWLHRHRSEGCTTAAIDEASRNGHLRVIRWLLENRSEGYTTAAMENAALAGKFEVLLLLHKMGGDGIATRGGRIEPSSRDINAWIGEKYPQAEDEEG